MFGEGVTDGAFGLVCAFGLDGGFFLYPVHIKFSNSVRYIFVNLSQKSTSPRNSVYSNFVIYIFIGCF